MRSENKDMQEFLKDLKKENERKKYRQDHFMEEILGIKEIK